MAFNVAPRPVISGLATPSGTGVGFVLTTRQSTRDRLRAGGNDVPNVGQESLETLRLNAQFDYEFIPRWTGILSVPFAINRFSVKDQRQAYEALGDLSVLGRWAFYRERGAELSLLGGAKLPSGSTSLKSDGVQLAATQQPGSGTTDFIAGAAGYRAFGRATVYGDLTYKYNLHSAYSFGNQLAVDAGVLVPVSKRWSLTGELNVEATEKDRAIETGPTVRADGVVTNTGGQAVYLAPGLQWRPVGDLAFSAGVQVSVYQYVNGAQLAAGLSYLFGVSTRLP